MAEPRGSLRSLDAPGAFSRRGLIGALVLLLVYAVAISLTVANAAAVRPERPTFVTAYSWAVGFVGGITALLLYMQAASSARRVYALLASTSLYMALVTLGTPLFFQGAVDRDVRLVGGLQSGPTHYYVSTMAYTLGVLAASIVYWHDTRTMRRPGLRHGVPTWVALTCLASGITLLVVATATDSFPPLIDPGASATITLERMDTALLIAAAATCLVSMLQVRRGSVINVFLAVLGVTLVGQTIVNHAAASRWTVAWYGMRIFQLVAMTALLVLLIWELGRITRWSSRTAERDSLTGALRRSHFHHLTDVELQRLAATGCAAALLWIDLDGFKSTNDRLGHQAGDTVLQEVALRLTALAGPHDLVSRMGGDEFGMLCVDLADAADADDIAVRIRQALRTPYPVADTTVLLSASVGIVPIAGEVPTTEVLLQRADLAMSAAKHGGGDRTTHFVPRMEQDAASQATLRAQLAEALRRRDFSLDYQPIVDVPSGQVTGVEALVRWLRDGRRIDASEFLPAIEATGQSAALGELVLGLLEADASRLLAGMGPTGYITVNLSVVDLEDARTVTRLLEGPLSGDAAQIVLEITETAEFEAEGTANRGLERLRLAGFPLAIDDFGTGYSNFSRLEHLKPAILKLDRSLVARSGSGLQTAQAFLDVSARIGHAIGAKVLAEGVETERDLNQAAQLGIDLAQGYYFSRPLPLDAALDSLRPGRCALPHPTSPDDAVHATPVLRPAG